MNNSDRFLSTESPLWNLEERLNISIWHDSLSLPVSQEPYTASEISLQESANFVFIRDEADTHSNCLVFLSDQTRLVRLFQALPFLALDCRCYLCNDQLIEERLLSLKRDESLSANNKATRLLSALLNTAANQGASDIHLEHQIDRIVVRMRINGDLIVIPPEESLEESLFYKIKLVSKMDIAKLRSPQDGHFPFTSDQGKRFDIRTSTIPGVYGEKLVMRLLPAASLRFSMAELGFDDEHISLIKRAIAQKSGMILFTGPTGSGKTTSLYAILNELIAEPINIVTIEDPVEYRLGGITQVQVNELAGITFSSALRAFLRQDPDVILVGEIRDQETAQIAARSAQTGHLVLSTLHSNDAFETIRRLKNLSVDDDDIASSIKLIVSQRLIQGKCVCDSDPACSNCMGSGTAGRIPLMEVLPVTQELRRLISQGSTIDELRSFAKTRHHNSLQDMGSRLVNEGKAGRSAMAAFLADD